MCTSRSNMTERPGPNARSLTASAQPRDPILKSFLSTDRRGGENDATRGGALSPGLEEPNNDLARKVRHGQVSGATQRSRRARGRRTDPGAALQGRVPKRRAGARGHSPRCRMKLKDIL